MRRPCRTCGTPTTSNRCPSCTIPGNNYGTAHQQQRRDLAATLPAPCAYGCGTILEPGSDWVAAHLTDGDPNSPRIASCRPCNEQAKQAPQNAPQTAGRPTGGGGPESLGPPPPR